jgi:hypothetical protein
MTEEHELLLADIFKVVNSAFFGQERIGHSLFDAVSMLGLDLVRTLVFSAQGFLDLLAPFPTGFLFSYGVNASTPLASARPIAQAEEAYRKFIDKAPTSGVLLHDLGKLVLAWRYREVLERVCAGNMLIWQAEREVLALPTPRWGLSDRGMGFYRWHRAHPGLPPQPEQSLARSFCPVIAVRVANYGEQKYRVLYDHYAPRHLASTYLQESGLQAKLPGVKEAMESEAEHG